jgi:adenine-specific DNA-methyltransferase
MVEYVQCDKTGHLFDPAVGACAFFSACRSRFGSNVNLLGTDIDLSSLEVARSLGLSSDDLANIEQRDFILAPPKRSFSSIVANPPYIRHHRLPLSTKQELRLISRSLLGKDLDGRAGLHVYFLLRSLERLEKRGKLAFIMPGDTFEGVFAKDVWNWVASRFNIEAVVTFSGAATPFPGVDTNAVVVMLENTGKTSNFLWAHCQEPETPALADWVKFGFKHSFPGTVVIRNVTEGLRTGLSRSPSNIHDGPTLADFARTMRGIATGDNSFFFLTATQADELGLERKFLKAAVGRTRDVQSEKITNDDLLALEREGRPTLLLSIGNTPMEELPASVQDYLRSGEARGVHEHALIRSRRPWYRMERRDVPPILFAYLGRRNTRFVRNESSAVPLTAFLCIYPNPDFEGKVDDLWRALNHPDTLANLKLVAKSYGSDAIKVEPRSLERLPIPRKVAEAFNLKVRSASPPQHSLVWSAGV